MLEEARDVAAPARPFHRELIAAEANREARSRDDALGASYHAGQAAGLVASCEELGKGWRAARTFEPKMSETERQARYDGWLEAVARVKSEAAS